MSKMTTMSEELPGRFLLALGGVLPAFWLCGYYLVSMRGWLSAPRATPGYASALTMMSVTFVLMLIVLVQTGIELRGLCKLYARARREFARD